MFDQLDSAIATIEAVVREFEPGVLDARGAVRAVERFAKLRHLGEAGSALAAKRVDETRAYRESGFAQRRGLAGQEGGGGSRDCRSGAGGRRRAL